MLTISAGHFGKGTGAVGYLDEGSEVVEVVRALHQRFQQSTVKVQTIIDQVSKNQAQNVRYLIAEHNKTTRELDVSIHFNAAKGMREAGIGTEVLYMNPKLKDFAATISGAIAQAGGFIDRGVKQRTDLAILKATVKPAIIIEICFVNSRTDVNLYEKHKAQIIEAIACTLESYCKKSEPLFSHPDLQQKIELIFNNKKYISTQLTQGVNDGVFDVQWLEKFQCGKLTLFDYLALTTVQFQKNLK